jgi:hypothetical protein
LADVAGWLFCRHPGLIDEVVVYRHQGQPVRELTAVVTSHTTGADWRTIRAEAEAALRALGYAMVPNWRRLSCAIHSPRAADMSQHRKLQGYNRVMQARR